MMFRALEYVSVLRQNILSSYVYVKAVYATSFWCFIVNLFDHYMLRPLRDIFRWYNDEVSWSVWTLTCRFCLYTDPWLHIVHILYSSSSCSGSRGSSVSSVWLRTGRPGDRGSIPGRGKRIFPPSVSRPALGPTQPPVQWVSLVLSPEVKRGRGETLTTHPHLAPRSWMSRIYTSPSSPSPPPLRLHRCVVGLLF
jgi:hypothetical protein